VPVIFVTFYGDFNFLGRFSKNTHIQNFMKILPVGAELFLTDGRTDMTNLIVPLRNFARAPRNKVGAL